MTTAPAKDAVRGSARLWAAVSRVASSAAQMSVALFALSFAVKWWAVGLIRFPMTEGSAYYVEVARNIATGRGFVIDAIWSYATLPLTLPRPAFELWQPMASLLAAVPMALFGPTFGSAQLAAVFLGAALAPLTWLVARDAARRLDLPAGRVAWVALGAGLLAAVAGPFLFAAAVPDSSLPFTVFAVAACLVMPRALAGERNAIVGLGILLGLAYLTRLEAVWLGAALAGLALVASRPAGLTRAAAFKRVAAVASVAAVVAMPWWLRNISVFGSPFPGQLRDNAFLTRNEQIFAWIDRPTLDGFLAQGVPQIAAHIAQAAWHNAVTVLLVPAAPIVIVASLTVAVSLWRRQRFPAALIRSPLGALLLAGTMTFVATSVFFPVATLWGTFEHASGPLLVGLAVVAVLGADAFVTGLVRRRRWERTNAWLAPLALVVLTLPLSTLQLASAARQSSEQARSIQVAAQALPAYLDAAGVPAGVPVITDRPVWLADALGRPALALPDESPAAVLDLARYFGAGAVVVLDERGAYPGALDAAQTMACFAPRADVGGAAVFLIDRECVR